MDPLKQVVDLRNVLGKQGVATAIVSLAPQVVTTNTTDYDIDGGSAYTVYGGSLTIDAGGI
jgi:hypothetical protein